VADILQAIGEKHDDPHLKAQGTPHPNRSSSWIAGPTDAHAVN
jgi:hypothetical protein